MRVEKEIEKLFRHDKIIENLARYELYYQISLGTFVYQTEFDLESTLEKLEELKLDIEPEHVFYTILAILRNLPSEEDFEERFDKELQKHASVNALEDYIRSDKELMNTEMFMDTMLEKINAGSFFDERMQKQFDAKFDIELVRWQSILDEALTKEIKDTALGMM